MTKSNDFWKKVNGAMPTMKRLGEKHPLVTFLVWFTPLIIAIAVWNFLFWPFLVSLVGLLVWASIIPAFKEGKAMADYMFEVRNDDRNT